MKVVYYSISGNCSSYVHKLKLKDSDLIELPNDLILDEKFILIIPTYDDPLNDPVYDFLEDNYKNCIGIIASGNRNFGDDGYIFIAKNLSKKYKIPIIQNFEYAGFDKDIEKTNKFIKENYS